MEYPSDTMPAIAADRFNAVRSVKRPDAQWQHATGFKSQADARTFISWARDEGFSARYATGAENAGSLSFVYTGPHLAPTPSNPTPWRNGFRGAPMGRPNCSHYIDRKTGEPVELAVIPDAPPFQLFRVSVSAGGYDAGGCYWGIGAPLYVYFGPVTDIHGFVRGRNRDSAKRAVRAIHPHARFFR